MKVYHTSNIPIEHPDTAHSREGLDFGKGFYVTKLKEQALRYAERFFRFNQKAFLSSFEYTPLSTAKTKEFDSYNDEWLDFIISCRRGENNYLQYDVVVGGVANDKVIRTIDLYVAGMITRETALERLVYEKPTHQICFISQTAIDQQLLFLGSEEIIKTPKL